VKRSSIFSSERAGPERARRGAGPAVVALLAAVAAYAVLERSTLPGPWNAAAAELVFLGTSHTFDAVDPEAFERPLGRVTFAGLDLQLAARTFERHRGRFPAARLLAVEIDDFSLGTDRVADLGPDLGPGLGPITGELHLWSTALPDRPPVRQRRAWKLRALLDGDGMPGLYWRRRPTLARLLERADPIREAPFAEPPEDLTAPGASAAVLAGRRVVRLETQATADPEPNLAALERLVARAEEGGLKVVLVGYPLHPAYAAVRPPRWERLVEEALRRVRAVSPGIEFLDYRHVHDLPEAAFRNVDHLSPSGARAFSGRLRADLERR
jgi:hypothetical protein